MIANGYNHWNSSTGYTTLNETDLTLYALCSIAFGGGGGGVQSGSGFQGPGLPYMLGEVTVAAKTPVKNNPTSGKRSSWYYGIPGVGPALESGDNLNKGNYWAAAASFGMALVDVFTLGEGTASRSVAKTSIDISVHAAERMVERGITERMIQTTIENGTKYFDPMNGTMNYIIEGGFASGKDILVGVSLETNKVTTVIRGTNLVRPRFVPIH